MRETIGTRPNACFTGNGLFIEKPWEFAAAGPESLARRIVGLHTRWVALKLAHETRPWPPDSALDRVEALVAELQGRGVETWGWGRVAGTAPASEGDLAVEALIRYRLKGWILEPAPAFPLVIAGDLAAHLKERIPTTGVALLVARSAAQRDESTAALADELDAILIRVGGAGEIGLLEPNIFGQRRRGIPVLELGAPWAGQDDVKNHAEKATEGRLEAERITHFFDACGAAGRSAALLSLDRAQRSSDCVRLFEAWKAAAQPGSGPSSTAPH